MNEHETQPVQPPHKTSWRQRSLGAPIVAGVAALCLILGGLGGAAVSAWADDDEPDGFGPGGGRFQEHGGHRGGHHGGPGLMMPPGSYGDDEYDGDQGGLPFGEQPDSEQPEAPESGTPEPDTGDGDA
ncbi:hypothetical protein LRP67_19485 [Nocardioides sp. cx-169]|uniref:hypothetical protein n=1 Tax=Nocardioides sp. cx-169 TaxID=2899080 RepID=UPI001E35B3B9|nr:hypothetical protein [Nocardioides sp. cx-169]MCD4536280.1 hypothetical protein [Nocardioides sp. cx-169]